MTKDDPRVTMKIDKNLLVWIVEMKKKGRFSSHSAGIRDCIRVAKRVYEQGSPEERDKFIIGSNISEK
jgi:Arc/MetJ-type ribon-helix-helix transcriptional regulator